MKKITVLFVLSALCFLFGGGGSAASAREINTDEVKRCAEDKLLEHLAVEGFRQQSRENVLFMAAAIEAQGGVDSKEELVEKLKQKAAEIITIKCLELTDVTEISPDQYTAKATFQMIIDSATDYSRHKMSGSITVNFVRDQVSVKMDPNSITDLPRSEK